ncbi:hypothetical protein A3L25_012900 [Pseudomonas putida]|uniref:Uncharacterized protein n=1 Tax=Pseudomonas putida TaxID=303 RepID=A0AAP9MYT0_PSEPU|nr:hypothetical protein [Pseudomonas putida]QJQ10267.1 hypothetical protein A3L25_012900 [Pseudomonas putida]
MNQQERLISRAALDLNTTADSTVQVGPEVGHSPTVHLNSAVTDKVFFVEVSLC